MSKIVPISFHAVFQFHYGTIKSDAQKKAQQAVFQFHYGTIKSHEFLFILELSSYFNSTMVRLKGRTCGFHDSKGVQFQFHYGTIKRIYKESRA